MDDKTLIARMQSLQPWHYALELAPGISTPIREKVWINRHQQRVMYFWTPLLQQHPAIFQGARVLDLGANAGFWTLRALAAGASHVTAVEARDLHIAQAQPVFGQAHVSAEQVRLIQANFHDLEWNDLKSMDLVLLLGILYHVMKPFELLERVAALRPKLIIIDTKISRSPESIFEIYHEELDDPRMAADYPLVAVPGSRAVQDMMNVLGYRCDVLQPQFTSWEGCEDFAGGDRPAYWCWRKDHVLAPTP